MTISITLQGILMGRNIPLFSTVLSQAATPAGQFQRIEEAVERADFFPTAAMGAFLTSASRYETLFQLPELAPDPRKDFVRRHFFDFFFLRTLFSLTDRLQLGDLSSSHFAALIDDAVALDQRLGSKYRGHDVLRSVVQLQRGEEDAFNTRAYRLAVAEYLLKLPDIALVSPVPKVRGVKRPDFEVITNGGYRYYVKSRYLKMKKKKLKRDEQERFVGQVQRTARSFQTYPADKGGHGNMVFLGYEMNGKISLKPRRGSKRIRRWAETFPRINGPGRIHVDIFDPGFQFSGVMFEVDPR